MHIEAQKTTVFVIHLSLGEALAALTNPAPLQKEIRALLPPGNPGPRHVTKKKSPKAAASATCEYCGKKFLARGLKKHERTCPQRPAA
jgi:hypothetical protein